jgi:peptidoglycan-N-acetylglucosamine deacetylase
MLVELVGGAALAAAGLMGYGVRGRSARMFGPSIWHGPANRPAIALTFDDGPSESTPEVLEALGRHGARATFFQCGANVRRLPGIARQVAGAGHEVGNHGDTHRPLYLRSGKFIRDEVARAQEAIGTAAGVTPRLFRAPYGARWFGLSRAQREFGLLGVMWTAIGRDWKLEAGAVACRLQRAARNGAIFCLHDGRQTGVRPDIRHTVEAVRRLVPELQARGFHFETVSELICPKA